MKGTFLKIIYHEEYKLDIFYYSQQYIACRARQNYIKILWLWYRFKIRKIRLKHFSK